MQDKVRKLLEQRLAELQGNERNKLMKRAAKLRKANQRKEKQVKPSRRGGWDEDAPERAPRRGGDSLHEWALRLLEEEELASEDAGETQWDVRATLGTVLWIGAGRCRIHVADEAGGAERECVLAGELARTQRTDLAVGDEVRFLELEDGGARVEAVLPRRTRLSRPDPGNPHRERVLAANVDVVVVIASVITPPLRPGLIDRFLIAAERGGAETLIAVNKLDLCTSLGERSRELAQLAPYRRLGLDVLPCSAATGEGVSELRAKVRGKLCVFTGHSGVGKSSLLNALSPELGLRTHGLRDADGKGRHTTTASTLHVLDDGIRVIDTPGIRSLGLWNLTPAELPACFPELAEHAALCRFGDCTHVHEPDCAVVRAAEGDRFLTARLDTYRRLLISL